MATSMADKAEAEQIPWWLVLLNGLAALIIGVLLLISPGVTTAVLVQLLGIYWFIAGIFSLISLFKDRSAWGWKLFAGIMGILAGLLVLQSFFLSALLVATTAIIILGIQGLIVGGAAIYQGFKAHTHWGQIILGVLSVIFGLILLANPLIGAITLPFVLGIIGVIGGLIAIVAAFKVKKAT